MGCCESASQKQYKLDMHNVIAKHRDVMRGLRMSEKDMEVLYELHLHFCGAFVRARSWEPWGGARAGGSPAALPHSHLV